VSDQDVLVLAREALAGDPASLVKLIATIVRTQTGAEPPVSPVPQTAQKIRFHNFWCSNQASHGHPSINAPSDDAVPQWQLAWTHLVTTFLNQLLADAAQRGVKINRPGEWKAPTQENNYSGGNYTCQEFCT